jgi:hypothetical protein
VSRSKSGLRFFNRLALMHPQTHSFQKPRDLIGLEPLLKTDRATLVFEATGDDKVRVNCQSWDDARVIMADQALLVAGSGKTIQVVRTDHPGGLRKVNSSGLVRSGDKVTVLRREH